MKKRFNKALLRKHPLIDTLFQIKGNPKVMTFIEPLWGIPFNLIAPYATLYMYSMGVSDIQIGTLMSISMFVQIFFAFSGGIFTDKLGRKTTTIMGDFFGWMIPCVIWALSQNFWFFLVAIVLNSFEQINQTAWTCLLVEDAKPKVVLNLYTWVTISGLLAVFVAPISGLLIQRISLVPVMRGLYFLFALGMTAKCLITYFFTTETKQGKIRKKETKNQSVMYMISEYKYLLPKIFKDKPTVKVLALMVLIHITSQISGSFFSLYATENLMISKSYLSIFPIIRAVIMLIFMFAMQEMLHKLPLRYPMVVGFAIYIVATLTLILSPKGSILMMLLYTLLEAFAFALVVPRKESIMALYIDPEERARIVSILCVSMFVFASPSGFIAGKLSSINRQFPFFFNIILFMIALVITIRFNDPLPDHVQYEDV